MKYQSPPPSIPPKRLGEEWLFSGTYVKKEEYHKRPLSKMMHDVAAELELI